ncbi:hypothetical protein ACF1N6_003939 [Vibrio vulnificus]|uniref:hypothetical protein n=1 Tax=Vibrio cholerae TaxID=666 RepID=UPI001A2AA9B6|nr:hypothetical protein [Vibrio vulnificus]EHD0093026.1 hypothetical protein [Vibrio vulnificus]
MSNKSLTVSAGANVGAAAAGAWAYNNVSLIPDPMLQQAALYAIPGLTIFAAFLMKLIGKWGQMSVSEMLFNWFGGDYLKGLKENMKDPDISEEKRAEYQREYETLKDAQLDMKRGKFKFAQNWSKKATAEIGAQLEAGLKADKITQELREELQGQNEKPQK